MELLGVVRRLPLCARLTAHCLGGARRHRRLFERYCAECHGFSGGGGTGPTFNDGRLFRDFPDANAQVEFVKKGKGIMPSFRTRMSSAQIQAVVRYEREVLSRRQP